MARRLFIHLGAHKSASSTIQVNLLRNQELLKQRGIWYIDPAVTHPTALGEHFRKVVGGKLCASSFHASVAAARDALATLLEPMPENAKVLISWEGFLGNSSLDLAGGIYPYIDAVVTSLQQVFEDYGPRYMMVIRRQDEFIESCYLQQVKERRPIEFSDFVKQIDPAKISWRPILERLKSVSKEGLAVVPFEFIKHNPAAVFVSHCLSGLMGQPGVGNRFSWKVQSNPSLSAAGVEMALHALPLIQKNAMRKEFMKFLRTQMGSDKLPKGNYLDDFTRNLLVEYCRADNEHVFLDYISDLGALEGVDKVRAHYLGLELELPRLAVVA